MYIDKSVVISCSQLLSGPHHALPEAMSFSGGTMQRRSDISHVHYV